MKVPDYREIELTLSRQNVVDQIAALLYATGIIHDDEHVVDIDFTAGYETVPMVIKLKKDQQVEIFTY